MSVAMHVSHISDFEVADIADYVHMVRAKAVSHANSKLGITADDLVSEGFLALMSAMRSYSPEKAVPFGAYAAFCVERRIVSACAKAQSSNAHIAGGEFDFTKLADERALPPDERVIVRETVEQIQLVMDRLLSRKERDAFTLYLSGCSYQEIARRMSVSLKSADNALTRARSKLKKAL